MQENVDEVIFERLQSPEMVFDPETGEDQRIVLDGGTGLDPDAFQTLHGSERGIFGYIEIVIPDEPRVTQHRLVRHERDRQQEQCETPGAEGREGQLFLNGRGGWLPVCHVRHHRVSTAGRQESRWFRGGTHPRSGCIKRA